MILTETDLGHIQFICCFHKDEQLFSLLPEQVLSINCNTMKKTAVTRIAHYPVRYPWVRVGT